MATLVHVGDEVDLLLLLVHLEGHVLRAGDVWTIRQEEEVYLLLQTSPWHWIEFFKQFPRRFLTVCIGFDD